MLMCPWMTKVVPSTTQRSALSSTLDSNSAAGTSAGHGGAAPKQSGSSSACCFPQIVQHHLASHLGRPDAVARHP